MAIREETLRFKVDASGSPEIDALARSVEELGRSGELTAEEFDAVAKGLRDVAEQAQSARGLQAASEQFKALARSVLETQQRIDAAKVRVAELGKTLGDTAEPTRKQVAEFERARNELQRLEQAQERQRAKLRELKSGFDAAGLSTRNLVAAEKELQQRVAASERAMAGVVASARNAAQARQQAAQAERAALDALRNTVAQQQRAEQATRSLERARETLAQRAQQGSASERAYAQSLGASAAKIAAIGAAALGINSAVGMARNTLSELIETAGDFQRLDVQLGAVFKDDAEEAGAAIRQLAQETPYQLQQISDAFVKLRAFGLDPMDGSFQAIADKAAELGGSQETLTGITLALGQAWAKQKLQGEEILQLVERGVPVWELLERATGKNVQELQKLSQAGKLGRNEIKLLVQEIGKSAEGASAELANTLPGQINRLKSQWKEFLDLVANSGVLDYLQEQLRSVSDEVRRMSESGELQAWASDIAGAIVGAAQAVRGATAWLYEHREAIVLLGEAYAGVKLSSAVAGFTRGLVQLLPVIASAGAGIGGAAKSVLAFAAGLGPAGLLIGAFVGSMVSLVSSIMDVHEAQDDLLRSAGGWEEWRNRVGSNAEQAKQMYVEFAETAIASAQELASKSRQGLEEYIGQLEGALEHTRAIGHEAAIANDQLRFDNAYQRMVSLTSALAAAREQLAEVREVAPEAMSRLGEYGRRAAKEFDDLTNKGRAVREAVSRLFDGIDLTSVDGLTHAATILGTIATRSEEAGTAVRDELRAQLLKLSDDDFAKFRVSALQALRDVRFGATDLGKAVDGINLERLGVDLDQVRTGYSAAGREAVDAFRAATVEVDRLGLTAEQRADALGQAFDGAFGRAKTRADLEALRELLQEAFGAGDIGVDVFSSRMDQVGQKIQQLQGAVQNVGAKPMPAPDTQQFRAGVDEAVKYTGEAAERMMRDQEQIAEKQASVSGALGGALSALAQKMSEFGKVSDAAALSYNRLVQDLFERSGAFSQQAIADGTGIIRFGEAVQQAAKLTEEAIEGQRQTLAGVAQAWTDMSQAQIEASAVGYGGLENMTDALRAQAQAAREGRSEFDLLGATDLGPLAAALDAAAARVDQLREKTQAAREAFEDYAQSARDQIDQLNGDMDKSEDRRFQRELDHLRQQAEESGQLSSTEYADAVAAATELHRLKMQQIQREADARRQSEEEAASRAAQQQRREADRGTGSDSGSSIAPGTATRSDVNITVSGKDLGSLDINSSASLRRFAEALLPEIMRQLQRSLSLTGRGR